MALEDASTRTVGENTIQASPAALRCSYTVNSRRGDYSLRKSNNQTNKDRRTHRRHARREGCTLDDTSSSSTTSPAFVIPLQLQTINQTLSMFESWQQNLVECQFYTSASAIPHGLFFFYLFKKQPDSCTEQASQGNMYNLANLASPTNCRFDRYIFVPRWQRRRSNHARSKKVQYISQRKRRFRRTSSQEIIRQSKMVNNKTVE